MSLLNLPDPPNVLLTKRFNDPMDGCDSKTFGRLGYTRNRDSNALVIPFNEDEDQRYSPKVSIGETILRECVTEHSVGIILLYHSGSGTVYEFDVDDFSEKPYEEEYGEERFQTPRGLRDAKYRWEIGESLFTNESFAYP